MPDCSLDGFIDEGGCGILTMSFVAVFVDEYCRQWGDAYAKEAQGA
jgi:hypothetical protein